MDFEKYYILVKKQAEEYDKSQNCKLGQTWNYHLLPVIENAKKLAELYGADKEVVECAALFHDYADLIDFSNRDKHHILGAEYAEKFLLDDNLPLEFVKKVKLCILNHRASVKKDKFSLEEICVADADAISHLEHVVELICWRAYLGEDVENCNKFVKNKIIKSFNKMSEQTKTLMRDKYKAVLNILY